MKKPTLNQGTLSWFLLGVIILLGAFLRFYDLGSESYWNDEVIMVHVAQEDLWSILQGGRPPLYIVFAHFWIKIFGSAEEATRSLSAVAGVISIPLMYSLGRQLFDERVGIVSAFLVAISQFQIYFSQDFRYYSFFMLFTLCSFYFYILFLKRGNTPYLSLYVIFSIFIFTHTLLAYSSFYLRI
jgi:uncharacterized membrane protein